MIFPLSFFFLSHSPAVRGDMTDYTVTTTRCALLAARGCAWLRGCKLLHVCCAGAAGTSPLPCTGPAPRYRHDIADRKVSRLARTAPQPRSPAAPHCTVRLIRADQRLATLRHAAPPRECWGAVRPPRSGPRGKEKTENRDNHFVRCSFVFLKKKNFGAELPVSYMDEL